ncbi:MAG: Recombination protein RecR [Phycisphaerae bacterium]|nr:Recombination protein RecR [Phycisphaerae bacterium]
MRVQSLEHLKDELQKLPGIGARTAERLTFHLLRASREEAQQLAQAILNLKETVRHCRICFNLTEEDPCQICSDPQRQSQQVWVVEQPKDLLALEATGLVHGRYHVLLGHISPLENIGPGDLTFDALLDRIKSERIEEVVLATNPTMEGDGTALYLMSMVEPLGVRVTRLARGLAVGSPLEYATPAMLEAAIRGRS